MCFLVYARKPAKRLELTHLTLARNTFSRLSHNSVLHIAFELFFGEHSKGIFMTNGFVFTWIFSCCLSLGRPVALVAQHAYHFCFLYLPIDRGMNLVTSPCLHSAIVQHKQPTSFLAPLFTAPTRARSAAMVGRGAAVPRAFGNSTWTRPGTPFQHARAFVRADPAPDETTAWFACV